jgi:hypothetical protein
LGSRSKWIDARSAGTFRGLWRTGVDGDPAGDAVAVATGAAAVALPPSPTFAAAGDGAWAAGCGGAGAAVPGGLAAGDAVVGGDANGLLSFAVPPRSALSCAVKPPADPFFIGGTCGVLAALAPPSVALHPTSKTSITRFTPVVIPENDSERRVLVAR